MEKDANASDPPPISPGQSVLALPTSRTRRPIRLPSIKDTMALVTESLTPSNHLPLEPTGLTPSFNGTPGFFTAEFGTMNPFDVDFHNATASPLRIEQPVDTPPASYPFPTDVPRSSVPEDALRRGHDPPLVPATGPRPSSMTPFKTSGLKDNSTRNPDSRLPPSPQPSPDALNPAFLDKSAVEFAASYLLPPALTRYGSSRGIHGQVTPPTDESRTPEDDSKSSPPKQNPPSKKRKYETDDEVKSEDAETPAQTTMNPESKDATQTAAETKRKKFLERNRLAASKCRQKKKEWANSLEEQARLQAQENKFLRTTVAQLRDECLYLKNFLLSTHSGCSCVGVKNFLLKEAQVQRMGTFVPITNLVQGYPPLVGYPVGDRRRSQSVGSVVTLSDRSAQGMSPQQ